MDHVPVAGPRSSQGATTQAARARYAKAFPELFAKELPKFKERDAFAAVDLALVLQHTGERRAGQGTPRSQRSLFPDDSAHGAHRLWDSRTLRSTHCAGETAVALAKLREAEQAGWRALWRYYRDFDPSLASIRNEPEFKAVFADIERDMAQQRARLAARPKDAPLELTDASR